ncbi:MAG TPA: hypothetical protein ACFYEG_08995 [Candidatus Wujingus californicus]|uniref:hypothetical protein n=1 Tax=Candidatus Wujingus californicus TaxID=3367618 RepID=UPI0040299262
MSKGSDSREFFEIFKTQKREAEDSQKKEIKHEGPDVSAQQKPHTVEDKSAHKQDPLGWIKSTSEKTETVIKGRAESETPLQPPSAQSNIERTPRKDEIILRQETLIIGAIAATFLSIACFFVGYKVGHNKALNQEDEWVETLEPQEAKDTGVEQKAPVVSQKSTDKTPPSKIEKQIEPKPIIKDNIKDRWTLRVVSYKNTKDNLEKAKKIARMIQGMTGTESFIVNTGKELYICVGEFESRDGSDIFNTQKTIAELQYENKKPFEGCYPVRMK